jgi:hypothetical protein
MKIKNLTGSIVLVLLLIVLPLVSFYFLQGGLNFFKKTYSEILPKGELPDLFMKYIDKDSSAYRVPSDSLYLLTIGLVYPGEDDENLNQLDSLVLKLTDAFNEDRSGMKKPLDIFCFVNNELKDKINTRSTGEFMRKAFISEADFVAMGISLGILSRESGPRNFILLSDQVGRIRQIYLSLADESLKELFKHASILIPAPERKDIIFDREKEK